MTEDTQTMQGISTPECLDAERAAMEAEALVVALEQRVRGGDEAVTAAQIAEQRDLASFARLRLESTRRKAMDLVEEHRQALVEELRAEVAELQSPVLLAFAELARSAMDDLLAALIEHNAAVSGLAGRMRELEVPVMVGDRPLNPTGMAHRSGGGAVAVAADGWLLATTSVPEALPGAVLAEALAAVGLDWPGNLSAYGTSEVQLRGLVRGTS